MKRIEEIISNALAGIPETEVAILARELLKTRESLALAQQAKGEAEGRAALTERRAVAGNNRLCHIVDVRYGEPDGVYGKSECGHEFLIPKNGTGIFSDYWNTCNGCGKILCDRPTIPADRVLGDGMVQVDREEWEAVEAFAAVWFAGRSDGEVYDASSVWSARRRVLRANQGGAAR